MFSNPISNTLGTVASLLMFVLCSAANAETLRIGGTGVALGGMTLLGDAFQKQNPGTTIEVLPSLGSSGGVKALIAGAIDLSVTSRPLKDAEHAKGARARLYATTPLAIVTSSRTEAETISTTELARMYAGEVTHWPSGQPVRLILRPTSETDTQILRGLSDALSRAIDTALKRPGLVMAASDQENAQALERLEGSLGAVALGQIATEGRQLKVLVHDGVLPMPGGLSAHGAIFTKSLYIVTTEHPSSLASRFLEFVHSAEARSILTSHDHTPAG